MLDVVGSVIERERLGRLESKNKGNAARAIICCILYFDVRVVSDIQVHGLCSNNTTEHRVHSWFVSSPHMLDLATNTIPTHIETTKNG
jgi:hypothetical protein